MNVVRLRAIALALPVLVSACAANGEPRSDGPAGGRTLAVQVTNNNWSDMVIYVLRGENRFRVGQVSSLSAADFEVPYSLVGPGADIQLAADPIGAERAFQTGRIHVRPGQLVELTVQNHLQVSYYSVWDG